jgi:hypothetical protein
VTKRGSNFYFWTGNVFPNRSSDFLSQNGQSGSLLVFWPHSVFGQNHLCVKDALNRDSAIQSIIRRFCLQKSEKFKLPVSRPDAILSTVPSVRTTCHSVQTSYRQALSVRTTCFFRPNPYTVSRRFCSSLLRPDVSAARPDVYQFSNGSLILSNFQEREDQSIVRKMWYPVSLRQESQFKINRPNVRQLWSGRVCIVNGNC